jgi:flavin-dependent dehydrogenase
LKAHATGVALEADLEMHFHADAYVGLCGIEDGRVNVCGLFRSRTPLSDVRRTWMERLRGPAGSPLRERLGVGVFDPVSFSAVAALPLGGGRRAAGVGAVGDVRIGDARGMIPPVTGNGMSMALEAAVLTAPRLAAWSRGEIPWDRVRKETDPEWERTFGGRLAWARTLQSAVMNPVLRRVWARVFPMVPSLWRAVYFRTR